MRMILLCTVLTAILGTTLYQVKIGIDARESELLTLEHEIRATEREIAVLEAEWAFLSRPERVLELSDRLLDMKPIPQDRILPIDAIPMRILPDFSDQLAEVGVITLLPSDDEEETASRSPVSPSPVSPSPVSPTRISADIDMVLVREGRTR